MINATPKPVSASTLKPKASARIRLGMDASRLGRLYLRVESTRWTASLTSEGIRPQARNSQVVFAPSHCMAAFTNHGTGINVAAASQGKKKVENKRSATT